jgi:hypothetical protein
MRYVKSDYSMFVVSLFILGVPLAISTMIIGLVTESQFAIAAGLASLGAITGASLLLYGNEL